MDFLDRINKDVMAAMKSKDKNRLNALRAIKSELQLIKTSGKSTGTINEVEGVKIVQKLIKQRKDSEATYQAQNRIDLYETEMTDIPFMEEYLPAQLSDTELEKAVKAVIEKTGSTSMRDMGKIMGIVNKQLAGQAESKKIAEIVKKLLSGN